MFNSKRIEELESRFNFYISEYPPVSPYKLWDKVEWDDKTYDFNLHQYVYTKKQGTITEIIFDKKYLRFKYTVTTKDTTYHYDTPIFTIVKTSKKGNK